MSDFLQLLQNPVIQIVGWTLGAIGWFIGIVSGTIQLKSYREQKQMENAYRSILEQAKRDWEGRYTEEQVNDLTQELKRLQELIRNDVPKQAKRVFLKDQLHDLSEDLGTLYTRHLELSRKLGDHTESTLLAPELRKVIEESIMPSYLAKHRQQQRMHTLLVILVGLSIVPFFLPLFFQKVEIEIFGSTYPLSWILLFISTVIVMVSIFPKSITEKFTNWSENRPMVLWPVMMLSWIVSLFLSFGLFVVSEHWGRSRLAPPIPIRLLIMFLVAFSLALSLIITFYALKNRIASGVRIFRGRA